jgi:predicted ATPase
VQTSDPILPNLVFIPADYRLITSYAQNPNAIRHTEPEALFIWLAQYWFNDDPRNNLEGMLRNLKVRDPQWFYRTLADVNTFLEQNGKHLTDFDNSLRLRVETNLRDSWHYIEELSSGEQQCLILIFMVSRWLMDGGIVLIDEPDLHLHGSWQRSLIHELERLVSEKNGQLIVTSHSSLVVEEFSAAQRFHLEPEAQHS